MIANAPQRMTPSEALVETMAANGVTDVFGIVGSAYMDALDIFPAAGIRFVPVAHEQGAAHMADGYARASGRHGVCIAQNGPGITNFVTAIAAAYWAHSPVVFITPESGSLTMGLGGFQETEQLPIFSKITKFQGHVNNPQAHGRDRRTLLRSRDARDGSGAAQHSARLFLRRYPGRRSARRCASVAVRATRKRWTQRRGYAGVGEISRHARRRRRDHERTLPTEPMQLAELLHAPVANSYLHNDSFPASHPLWCGPLGYQGSKAAMKLIAQADVVLALGTRLGPFGTLPQHGMEYWPAQAKIIQVDVDPEDARSGQNHHGRHQWRRARRRRRLDRSACRVARSPASRTRTNAACVIAAEKCAWERELSAWTHERDPFSIEVAAQVDCMHPRQVLRELERAMPPHAMVSTDIGNICSVANSYLRFEAAALDVRGDELRQLWVRVPGDLRCEGRGAAPAGDRLCRRRRMGHQPQRTAHLCARKDRRDRDRLQQRPVGRGERRITSTSIRGDSRP